MNHLNIISFVKEEYYLPDYINSTANRHDAFTRLLREPVRIFAAAMAYSETDTDTETDFIPDQDAILALEKKFDMLFGTSDE